MAHGQRVELGDVVLEIRHTPGHTPESICVVVWEHAADPQPWARAHRRRVVHRRRRPPRPLTAVGWSADDLARQLYRSLRDQLLTLPDTTRVFPAHGAGSACGKSMSDAVSSTIGEQRKFNYALRPMSEDDFVAVVTEGQSVAPLYFAFTADSNRRSRELLDDTEAPVELDIDGVARCAREGALLIDTRAPEAFASGHLRGSVNVGLDGRFAEYAGDVARPGQPIVLVGDDSRTTEAKVRLARIGFDRVRGALVDVERTLAEHPERCRARRPARRRPTSPRGGTRSPALQLVDVRNPSEQRAGTIPGAVAMPLARLLERFDELDRQAPTVVYCAGGYRSSIAASLLRSLGFDRVADLQGGYEAWTSAGLPTGALAVRG